MSWDAKEETMRESKEKTPFKPLGVEEIKKILPHRYPFLFVDRVIACDLEEKTMVSIKNVTANDHFFEGHFPGAPIMPGVLILEALAQSAGMLASQMGYDKEVAVLLGADKVKFRRAVLPGDQLELHVKMNHLNHRGGKITGPAKVDGSIVCQCEVTFAFMSRDAIRK